MLHWQSLLIYLPRLLSETSSKWQKTESLVGPVLSPSDQSIRQSPHSYLRPVDDTNLSAVSDTPLPVKLPQGIQSGYSSAPGPYSNPPSRGSYSDQFQQSPEAMRMEMRRLQKSILAKRQYLAVINKAKVAAMQQLHRKQLEHEAAREKADCDREKAHREHQARMCELLEREREEEEYLARINSELRCDELQVHFQRIHPRRRSRSPLPPQFCYPTTPITSSSLSYSSQSDNSYQNHQQYYPASQDVRATLLPTPPIRVQ